MDKLFSCPFCGEKAKFRHIFSDPDKCMVCCTICDGSLDRIFKTEAEATAAWNRRAQPENKPLTLDELREMDGEPVWVYFLNSKVSVSGQWHLVRNITKEVINCFENYMPFCDYGKTWLAYRHKPEEARHGD